MEDGSVDVRKNLDESLLAALPEGKVVAAVPLGLSYNCDTFRIEVRLPDGKIQRFFEKAGKGQDGFELMQAHFVSETSLYSFIPEFVPRPVGFGTYISQPDTHFFLMDFVDMTDDEIPTPKSYMAPVIALHLRSMGKSPTGKFGFSVKTRFGHLPQANDWESSWELWWTRHMKMVLDREEQIRGPHTPEAMQLKELFLKKVLPRYLRPLETGGRSIRPCLLHTDLWPGNVKYNKLDNETASVFDANGLWAHNEVELGLFRNPRYLLGEAYIEEYGKHVRVSDPIEDADSRNIMYLIRHQVCLASVYPNDPMLRDIFVKNLRLIVNRVLQENRENTELAEYNHSQITGSTDSVLETWKESEIP